MAINPAASQLGTRNAIIWGRATRYHVANFPGPFSIKTVIRGSASWQTSEAERMVDPGSYLVLNAGRPYSITIDSRETTETFCLFFRDGVVEDACRAACTDATTLLDGYEPAYSNGAASRRSAEFLENLHTHDGMLTPVLRQIYARVRAGSATQLWLEDQFLAAAVGLRRVRHDCYRRAALVPAKKPATRCELYRRLLRGKDYMDSFPGANLGLAEIAAQACLSPFHFHRLFREVFRETPNEYLQRQRLARAKRMLEGGELSVTDICLEIGFESVTSFSGLFRRRFGCSPREYRLHKNNPARRSVLPR